jgi:hypothetical protein
MQALRIVLLVLCCAASAAAQEIPSADVLREAEFRRGGTLLPAQHAAEESRRAIAVLRAYATTGDERHFREALRRTRHLAAFDPRGSSAEDSLSIAWALALGYDWLDARLDLRARQELIQALRIRAATLFHNARPDTVPALIVIARVLAANDFQARAWLLQLARET